MFLFPFIAVVELDTFKLDTLTKDQLNVIEADSFWCLSKFLDCIQDNYIFAQLGIQAKVNQLKELIQRIDGMPYFNYFQKNVQPHQNKTDFNEMKHTHRILFVYS